jgi:hypothetical protein
MIQEGKMNLWQLANEKTKKMDMLDVGFIKIVSFVGGLLIAKLWKPILSLDWYWYLIIVLLALIKPAYSFLKK